MLVYQRVIINCDLGEKKGCADGYWMPVNRTGGIILNDATRFKPCTLKMANFQSPHVFCSEVEIPWNSVLQGHGKSSRWLISTHLPPTTRRTPHIKN